MTAEPHQNGGVATNTSGLRSTLRDAAWILVACSAAALTINATVHPRRLPLIARKPYQVLVPCPDLHATVASLSAVAALSRGPNTLVIDARSAAAFAAWHLPGAERLSYDFLAPTPSGTLRALAQRITQRRLQSVLVYGDGDNPDSGTLLAQEIAGQGIRHVRFVQGGAAALQAAQRQTATAPQTASPNVASPNVASPNVMGRR